MSAWKFKAIQKTRNAVILQFNDSSHEEWGDTMSVTIPASDAQKLLAKLQTALDRHGAHDHV
ncbi:MAG TPA: hypothetical protein VGR84_16900 [Candidatus Acidoferrales bacterium]|nr:hypothetical protein [Candidatus Acidoferrales bacterium]